MTVQLAEVYCTTHVVHVLQHMFVYLYFTAHCTVLAHAACPARVIQVEFIGNTAGGQGGAGQGGAVFMESQVSCQMTEMTFRNNFATDRGGAIYMAGQLTPQPVATLAAMCASNNSATFGGGFAYLESGTAVTFTDATNSHVGDSRPNTIEISGSATVTSTGTPGGWATGSYTLIGPVGPACAAQFANNTANDNSCNSCSGGTSWFAVLCSCQVSGKAHNAWYCDVASVVHLAPRVYSNSLGAPWMVVDGQG